MKLYINISTAISMLFFFCMTGLSAQDFEVEVAKPEKKSEKKEKIVLANITVTGTKSKKLLKKTPVKTELIDREKIEAKGARNLFEALNSEMGVLVENNCQNCAATTVRLNGLDGNYSQILFNGLPTVSSLAGVYLLQQVPAEMIERIEVVRGGGSALYGSGAIGGVINVIRRKPVKNGGSVRYEREWIAGNVKGERDIALGHTLSGNASVVSDSRKTGLFIWGSKRTTEAWDANDDAYSDLTEDLNKSMGVNGYYSVFPGLELTYAFSTIHAERRGGNKLSKEVFDEEVNIAEAGKVNRDTAEVTIEHEVNEKVSYKAFYGYAGTKRKSYYPDLEPFKRNFVNFFVRKFGRRSVLVSFLQACPA